MNCSCGDKKVSKEYGLFVTYPLSPGENLSSIANDTGLAQYLLQSFNPNSDFSKGSGLVFIPGKGKVVLDCSTLIYLYLQYVFFWLCVQCKSTFIVFI